MAIIEPKAVNWTRLRLLALGRAIHRSRGILYDAVLLQGIMTEALHNQFKATPERVYACPTCLLLWSTAERRKACEHRLHDGQRVFEVADPDLENSFRHWLKMAEVERMGL